jgi:hypothetical protein
LLLPSLLLLIVTKFPVEIQRVISTPSSFVIRQIWNKFNLNYQHINDNTTSSTTSRPIRTEQIISSNLIVDYDFFYKFLLQVPLLVILLLLLLTIIINTYHQILTGQGLLHFFAYKSGYLDGFD